MRDDAGCADLHRHVGDVHQRERPDDDLADLDD
jgi:hypothetical protein